jgi:hypothetical protein
MPVVFTRVLRPGSINYPQQEIVGVSTHVTVYMELQWILEKYMESELHMNEFSSPADNSLTAFFHCQQSEIGLSLPTLWS